MTNPVEQATELQSNAAPCTIATRFGEVFVVTGVDAWSYVPQGVFASGHWESDDREADVLIPSDQILYIELHFDKLREILEERAA